MTGYRLLRLAALASLIWRIGLLPGELTACGPAGPHGHELIGQAGPHALRAHLEAEAACRTGEKPAQQPGEGGEIPGGGLVLSTGGLARQGEALAALDITALLPPVAAPDLPAALWTRQRPASWAAASLEQPPPCPPPNFIACAA